MNYKQSILLNKLKSFLRFMNKKHPYEYTKEGIDSAIKYLDKGHCSGITALLFYYEGKGKLKDFYTSVDNIVGWDEFTDPSKEVKRSCKNMIQHIRILQGVNPTFSYLEHEANAKGNNPVDQSDYHCLLNVLKGNGEKDFVQEYRTGFVFKEQELIDFFEKFNFKGKLIRLGSTDHAIGFSCDENGVFRLFDSNGFNNGKSFEMEYKTVKELVDSIKKQFLTNFKVSDVNIPIRMAIFGREGELKRDYPDSKKLIEDIISKRGNNNCSGYSYKTWDNRDALYMATRSGDHGAVNAILEKSGIHFGDNYLSDRAFIALESGFITIFDAIKDYLAKKGKKPTINLKEDLLYRFTQNNYIEGVSKLLELNGRHIDSKKPSYDIKNEWKNKGLLHVAAENGHSDLINLLHQKGADLNLTTSLTYKTPLHLAVEKNNFNAVIKLLFLGADTQKLDHHDKRPYEVSDKDNSVLFKHLFDLYNLIQKNEIEKIKAFKIPNEHNKERIILRFLKETVESFHHDQDKCFNLIKTLVSKLNPEQYFKIFELKFGHGLNIIQFAKLKEADYLIEYFEKDIIDKIINPKINKQQKEKFKKSIKENPKAVENPLGLSDEEIEAQKRMLEEFYTQKDNFKKKIEQNGYKEPVENPHIIEEEPFNKDAPPHNTGNSNGQGNHSSGNSVDNKDNFKTKALDSIYGFFAGRALGSFSKSIFSIITRKSTIKKELYSFGKSWLKNLFLVPFSIYSANKVLNSKDNVSKIAAGVSFVDNVTFNVSGRTMNNIYNYASNKILNRKSNNKINI